MLRVPLPAAVVAELLATVARSVSDDDIALTSAIKSSQALTEQGACHKLPGKPFINIKFKILNYNENIIFI
jgi:hypothetical protein